MTSQRGGGYQTPPPSYPCKEGGGFWNPPSFYLSEEGGGVPNPPSFLSLERGGGVPESPPPPSYPWEIWRESVNHQEESDENDKFGALFWPNSTNYLQESHEHGGLETLFWRKKANYQQESDEHDKCEVVDCQGTAALYDYFVIIIATTKGPKLGMQAGTTVKTRKANGGQDSHVVPSVGLQVSKSTAKPRSAPFPCAGKH